MGEGHYSGGESSANQRLTVREAADQLGISEAAVRNRIKRGTLGSEKLSGRVYVVLAGAVNQDESTDTPTDESELVAVLREQLAAEREANRENRRIIAGLIERIPELEAPQNQAESAEPRSDRVDTSAATSRPAEGGSGSLWHGADAAPEDPPRRPWWRRWLGG